MPEQFAQFVGDIAPVPIIVGLVWAFYWLVSSGRLVPKSTVDLLQAANDKVIAGQAATIASQEKQLDAFQDASETTKRVLEALHDAGTSGVNSNVRST